MTNLKAKLSRNFISLTLLIFVLFVSLWPFIRILSNRDRISRNLKIEILTDIVLADVFSSNSMSGYSANTDSLVEDDKHGLTEELFVVEAYDEGIVGSEGTLRSVTLTNHIGETMQALLYEPIQIFYVNDQKGSDVHRLANLDKGYMPLHFDTKYLGYLTDTTSKITFKGKNTPVYRTYIEGSSIYPLEREYKFDTSDQEVVNLNASLFEQELDHIYFDEHDYEEDMILKDRVFDEYKSWGLSESN